MLCSQTAALVCLLATAGFVFPVRAQAETTGQEPAEEDRVEGPKSDSETWDELNGKEQAAATALGYRAETWDKHIEPPAEKKSWEALTYAEQGAAKALGWSRDTWNAKVDATKMCEHGPSSGSKHVIFHAWSDDEDAKRREAVDKSYQFLDGFSKTTSHNVSHLVVNSISFFVESASNLDLPKATREAAKKRGREVATSFEQKLIKKWHKGTFGLLLGVRKDLLDAFQVLVYEHQLGMEPEKSELMMIAEKEYFKCKDCFTRGHSIKEGDETDAAIEAYVVDEARFRFGEDKFRARKELSDLWPMFLSSLDRSEDDETTAKQRRKANFLATHLGFIASGFGRYVIRENELPLVFGYVRRHFSEALLSGDEELVAEFTNMLKLLGCDEEDDGDILAGTRFLLKTQLPDGSWGKRRPETVRNLAETYDVLHHTWTAASALMTGPSGEGAKRDTYAAHLIEQAVPQRQRLRGRI
jgi:hypothetical protein